LGLPVLTVLLARMSLVLLRTTGNVHNSTENTWFF